MVLFVCLPMERIDFFTGGKHGARPTWNYFNEKFIQYILTDNLHMFYYIGAQKRSYEAKFPLIFPLTFMNILDHTATPHHTTQVSHRPVGFAAGKNTKGLHKVVPGHTWSHNLCRIMSLKKFVVLHNRLCTIMITWLTIIVQYLYIKR